MTDTLTPHPRPARSYGVVPLETLRSLDGIELFRSMIAGDLPGAPIARIMGMWLDTAEVGRVVFGAQPAPEHYNPIGSVHGGFAGTLLDSCMSCAVQTTLKKGFGYTTLEYKVNLVRAITDRIGPVFAEGKVVSVGSRIGTAEGRITDREGKLYAHGTTTCLIFPI